MNEIENNIADLLLAQHGVDISKYKGSFINKSLQKRIQESGCGSLTAYLNILQQNLDERLIFLDSLHISYTEFFRNSLTFAVLERLLLPTLLQKQKKADRIALRIWSAACATGQEPYSVAMVLEENKNINGGRVDYQIFATDREKKLIDLAQNGQYMPADLDNLSLKRVNRWFTLHGGVYSVNPELKTHIDFSVFDLFDEKHSSPPASIFGSFDLILCANLFFYYKIEFRDAILDKISQTLAKGGFIITGEAEREIFLDHRFTEIFPHSAVFSR